MHQISALTIIGSNPIGVADDQAQRGNQEIQFKSEQIKKLAFLFANVLNCHCERSEQWA